MFTKYSYVLKHTAIGLVTDSLENTVPITLTRHFEASQWATNTNKSHELNSLAALPASFTWIVKEEMPPLSANQLRFFHWRKKSVSSKLETHGSQVLRKRLAYPWGRLWGPITTLVPCMQETCCYHCLHWGPAAELPECLFPWIWRKPQQLL